MYLHMLVTAVGAYIIGSINGAIIASKYIYRVDIRSFGSGNPGLTNFYRVFGKSGVLLVLAIDILKTAISVLFGGWLFEHQYDWWSFGTAFAGFFAMIGHSYPVFYKFKGGKTVMSAGTVLFFVDWRVALFAWGTFFIIVILTKYVSLGSIIAGISYPVFMAVFKVGTAEIVIASLSAALIIFRHRENIQRFILGTESKFSFRKNKE